MFCRKYRTRRTIIAAKALRPNTMPRNGRERKVEHLPLAPPRKRSNGRWNGEYANAPTAEKVASSQQKSRSHDDMGLCSWACCSAAIHPVRINRGFGVQGTRPLARGIIVLRTAASGHFRSSRSPMRSGRIGSRISWKSPSLSVGTRVG
jgi:hypothetical protein